MDYTSEQLEVERAERDELKAIWDYLALVTDESGTTSEETKRWAASCAYDRLTMFLDWPTGRGSS